jgi:hypothetical protein
MRYFKANFLISFIILALIESSWPTAAFSIENMINSTSSSSTTKIINTNLSSQNNTKNSVPLVKSSLVINATSSLSNDTSLTDELGLNNTFRERRQICKTF